MDGPRVHRAGDSGWIEFSVDGRATGAETTRTVLCVPGGVWSGRSAVQLAAGKCTRLLQSEGQHPTGGRGCHIRGKDQLHVRGGFSGNPVRQERAERGRPWRRTEALVDSSTRRIRAWRVATKTSGASRARQSCAQTPRDFSRGGRIFRASRFHCVCTLSEDGCARQTRLSQEKGGGV